MIIIISCVIVRCVVARKTLKNCISQLCKNNNNHTKSNVHARVRVHRLLLKSSSFSMACIYSYIILFYYRFGSSTYYIMYLVDLFTFISRAMKTVCVHHLNILMPLASKAEADETSHAHLGNIQRDVSSRPI